MAVTDRRIPGVYVTIEDVSYVAPPTQIGRTVFCVGVCPQGPHNRVFQVTSQQEFQKYFGDPDFYRTSKSHYIMDKAMQYTGRGLYIRVVPEDATQACALIKKNSGDLSVEISGNFTWSDSEIVIAATDVSSDLVVGDWIFNNDEDISEIHKAKQIIDLVVNTDGTTEITLDSAYNGLTGSSTGAFKFAPFNVVQDSGFDAQIPIPDEPAGVDSDVVYGIYAIGAGKYYNDYKIRGYRNVELEKMFTDEDGEPKFKYMFMDLGVYKVLDDGHEQLVEGPWTVSLVNKTPQGVKIRDLSSGQPLFIQNVINRRSDLIRLCAGTAVTDLKDNTDVAETLRKNLMVILSSGDMVGTNLISAGEEGVLLGSGDDGTVDGVIPLYDPNTDYLYIEENMYGLITQAYNGSLTSIDGSIEKIREVTYPVYEPDYILAGNWPPFVQNAARQLSNIREDCITLGDTGCNYSVSDCLDARQTLVPWNNWTSALYGQYRKRFDEYTGEWITISPVYHAIENHLNIDSRVFLGEPVAGIEKGAIAEPIELMFQGNHTELGDMWDNEINSTIVEPDGVYFLTQFTTWKRLSILKRLHAAKFVAYIRKMVPPLLKDLLQRKGTKFWQNQAQFRVDHFLKRYMETDIEAYKMLDSYSVNVEFDDVSSELNVYIHIKPIRVIERINVYIIVE